MNLNNFFYIFTFFNGVRTKKITEGKHFFYRNYSGLSWHLRERRYLLMTKRGPVEYVFNLRHYLVCFAVLSKYFFLNFEIDLLINAAAIPKITANKIENNP